MSEIHTTMTYSLRRCLCLGMTLASLSLAPSFAAQSEANGAAVSALRITELLASNESGLRDERGQTSDWIEFKNTSSEHLQLAGYHLSDDFDTPNKWSFPEYLIPPGEHLLVWLSGRESNSPSHRLGLQSARSIPFGTLLVDANASWKYEAISAEASNQEQQRYFPNQWTNEAFVDAHFATGQGGFGYGDDDDKTIVPENTSLVILRRTFKLDQPFTSHSLGLRVDYDDGFIAFLNGTQVASKNAPREPLRHNSFANNTHEAGEAEYFDLSSHADLLKKGTNIVAIAGLNNSVKSSDLSIHAVLGLHAPVLHANFKLKKKGGEVYLVAPNGAIADRLSYKKQRADQSLGRPEPSKNDLAYYLTPTPGSENVATHHASPITARLLLNPQPGHYEHAPSITIQTQSSIPVDIRYTNDGTIPTDSSKLYQSPIDFDKTGLIRAAAFVGSEKASSVITGSYVIGTHGSLPLVSITMSPEDFRDVQLQNSATGHGSERSAFLEYIRQTGEPILTTGFGLRLHGGAGRNGGFETKKSYRAYFRKRYGVSRFSGEIIPDATVKKFDKFVLRASSNDRAPHGSSIRDQVIRDLHADMGALAASGSWCVLQINGFNRGVYNISERMDEEFFSSHLGKGSYDVMKTGETILNGDREDWDDLRRFIERTDFSRDKAYQKLSQRVDIENLTSYVIVNMCLQNFDWPHNNWYAARKKQGGKWLFLCWDSEWGLGYRLRHDTDAPLGIDLDPYAFMDSGGGSGNGLISRLFLKLLDNAGYRSYYQDEVRRYLAGPLSTENIVRQIRRHRDAIANDLRVEYESKNQDIQRWHALIEEIEHFATVSPQFFQQHTDDYFNAAILPDIATTPATFVSNDQGLQIIQRTSKGALHRLSRQKNTDTWSQEILSLPSNTAPLTGAPKSFTTAPHKEHLLYRDTTGNLHTLELPKNDSTPRHQNLSVLLKIPPTDNDPSVVMVNSQPHIVYIDRYARLHELWWNGHWRHHPLPAAPRPASAPNISARNGTLYVNYQTCFGAPCEQSLRLDDSTDSERPWRYRITYRIPCDGSPISMSVGEKRRLIFKPRVEWPSSEPFVFAWNGRDRPGYKEYNGPRNGLVQAWDQRQRFRHLEPLGTPLSPPIGKPISLRDTRKNQHYVAYRSDTGHIHEAQYIPATRSKAEYWNIEDLTQSAKAPMATTDPIGMIDSDSEERRYLFLDESAQLHALAFSDQWRHLSLSDSEQDD